MAARRGRARPACRCRDDGAEKQRARLLHDAVLVAALQVFIASASTMAAHSGWHAPEPEAPPAVDDSGGFHGDAEVDCGQPMVAHGVATLGDLSIECGGEINEQVWGAGAALATWLLDDAGGKWLLQERPDIVELGAGTGIVGLAAACAGASRVVLTDLPAAVPALRKIIRDNDAVLKAAGAEVEVQALTWGNLDQVYDVAPEGCDLVLGADLLYNPENFDALLGTLLELAQIREARVLIATEQRWENVNEEWERALARSGFEVVQPPSTAAVVAATVGATDEVVARGRGTCSGDGGGDGGFSAEMMGIRLPTSKRLPRPVTCIELRIREGYQQDEEERAKMKAADTGLFQINPE